MEIIFILVEPALPENIGLSLRAMNTMGFKQMRIVGKFNDEASGLRKTAYGSHELIEQVMVFHDLDGALQDIDMAVGTTAKKRTVRKDAIPSSDLRGQLNDLTDSVSKVAIVFGSEESGLSREDINRCDVVSTIPLAGSYPSLNLSQSVMVYAYELADLQISSDNLAPADPGAYQHMKELSLELLRRFDFERSPTLYRRFIDRISLAGSTDTHLILSFLQKVKRHLDQGETTRE